MCNKLRDVRQSQTDGLLTKSETGEGNSNTRNRLTYASLLHLPSLLIKNCWAYPQRQSLHCEGVAENACSLHTFRTHEEKTGKSSGNDDKPKLPCKWDVNLLNMRRGDRKGQKGTTVKTPPHERTHEKWGISVPPTQHI